MILQAYTDIGTNLERLHRRLLAACQRVGRDPKEITIVAVTKGVSVPQIEAAFQAGLHHFGENRLQEAAGKIPRLAQFPITWHMVGHLQTNKAKAALGLFHIIHSLDSLRLAEVVSRHAPRQVPVFLQVNVSGEATKFGLSPQEVPQALAAISRLSRLQVQGLMTIAPLASNPEAVRPVFRGLRQLRDSLGLEHLSMGMSDDFEVAVEEGATWLRIGRAIFGQPS